MHGLIRGFKLILALLLIIAVLVFAIQNVAAVDIRFLVWDFSLPRALMIGTLLGIGFLIGVLFYSLILYRRR